MILELDLDTFVPGRYVYNDSYCNNTYIWMRYATIATLQEIEQYYGFYSCCLVCYSLQQIYKNTMVGGSMNNPDHGCTSIIDSSSSLVWITIG